MRVAASVVLTDEQRRTREQWVRGRSLPARHVERARIVLLAADGELDSGITAKLGITNQKAARWRARFLERNLAGLKKHAPRPGRTPSIDAATVNAVIRKTTQERPANATHRSTRSMAAEAGISEASVRRIWKAHGLKPHLVESFRISNDPTFAKRLEAIIGLCLHPLEQALVLSCDEKSQIQALDRTQPGLPLKRGRGETMTHDYKPNGTATLFAALNATTGEVIAMCQLATGGRCDARWQRGSHHRRQLCHTQTPESAALAGPAVPFPHAFHPNQCLVAKHGGALLPGPNPAKASARRVS